MAIDRDGAMRGERRDRRRQLPRLNRFLGGLLAVLLCPLLGEALLAQAPPSDPLEAADDAEILSEGGLQPEAFYLLNDKGVRLMYPGLSFAEIERLRKMDEGTIQPTRTFNFESIEIAGKAETQRAELDVTVRLQVDPTGPSWIAIPLLMGNFNRLEPADVSGIEHWQMTLNRARGGYVLWVQADAARDVIVEMPVSVRVDQQPRSAIRFRLPEAPTAIELTVPQADAVAEVEGRGNEDIQRLETPASDESRFRSQSGGGEFSMLWGNVETQAVGRQVLEAESSWDLVWMSLQDRPTGSIDLRVRNLRGDVQPFEIEIPAALQLLDSQGAELIPISPSPTAPAAQRFRVQPEVSTGTDQVVVKLEVELGSRQIDTANPLTVDGIVVLGAVRQTGEIELRSDQQYRLRWDRRPWVQSVWSDGEASNEALMVYRFTYDRVPFDLPLWLVPKQRRLLVESNYEMRIDQALATLQMTIRTKGATPDGRILRVNTAGWQIQSVATQASGESLDTFVDGDVLEIDLSSIATTSDDEIGLTIRAGRELPLNDNLVQLPIPRVLFNDESTMVQPGELAVRTSPGLSFISNLSDSVGIEELVGEATDDGDATTVPLRYSVESLGPAAVLSGFLEKDRPQVTLEADLLMAIEGDRLLTTADWLLRPQRGMTGQIPLAFTSDDDWQAWDVTVDQQPAVLREVDDQIVLFSDELVSGRHTVRFRRSDLISLGEEATTNALSIRFPRPALTEVTIGDEVALQLKGSVRVSIDAFLDGQSVTDTAFEAIPDQPLTVRVNRRETQLRRLLMPRVVVQSRVGLTRRYERLVATVVGSGTLRLALRDVGEDLMPEVQIDGSDQVFELAEEGALLIPLAADKSEHVLDVRVWYSTDEAGRNGPLRPAFVLPVGTGRLFWDLLLPGDEHVVWASPTLGRAMHWTFDRWRLRRQPTQTSHELVEWAGAGTVNGGTLGNRYLFTGADPGAVRVLAASKPLIWAIVGGSVLAIATSLLYFPWLNHPLSLVVAAVAICGLTLLAPDAAVVTGQLTLLSLLLVAVMLGVRAVLRSRPHDRVFDSSQTGLRDGSTRSQQPPAAQAADPGSGSVPISATVSVGEGN